ncbi:MAG: hypothetical protein LBL18_05470 [Bacteroidales bacterium]|jgi:hypothetical protein|nr:hypothetical protein [Bacteroidales bacterium]
MKKRPIILAAALFAILSFSSCLKRNCICEAQGYASQAYLQEVLERYGQAGCMDVVKQGGHAVDYTGVELYCYEN